MSVAAQILPKLAWGGGPSKMVEGYPLPFKYPSTTLRVVPLPIQRMGRIQWR
jgi:hypothetical protein